MIYCPSPWRSYWSLCVPTWWTGFVSLRHQGFLSYFLYWVCVLFCPVFSLVVALAFCWPHIQVSRPLCISLVSWFIACAFPTGISCYLPMAMHYSQGQRPSPSVDEWYMVWWHDGHMITVAQISWHLSYGWGKTPEKISARKLTPPGIGPGSTVWEIMMLPPRPQW